MEITLYKNFSKKLNSTKRPSEQVAAVTMNAHFKDDTSIESPTFIVDGIDLEYNYAKAFGHYYFIDDITVGNNKIFELHCTQDILATHKTAIGNYSAYIERSSSHYDGNLIDNILPVSTDVDIDEVSDVIYTNPTGDGICYIIGVSGSKVGGKTFGSTTYYSLSATQFDTIAGALFPASSIWNMFQNSSNPAQYITSIMRFPFNILSGDSVSIVAGNTVIGTGNTPSTLSQGTAQTLTIPKHPLITQRGDWVKHGPYSRYTLTVQPFGEIPIDADLIADSEKIFLHVRCDLVTGIALLDVRLESATGELITQRSAKVGANVQIAQNTALTVSEGVSAVVGVAGAAGMAASGNMIGSALAMASTVGNAVANAFPQVSTVGSNGSIISFNEKAVLRAEFRKFGGGSNTLFGRPYCKQEKISNHSGYVKCSNASIELSSLGNDKAAVNEYLNSGFYYE